MDFVVELPECGGATTIMTIVDSFSKMALFVPLVKTDAVSVAQAFFVHLVAQFGLP